MLIYSESKVPEEKVKPAIIKGAETTIFTSYIVMVGDRCKPFN